MEKKIIAQNKKASFDYFIDETIEAGIVLSGAEVKSLRTGKCNLTDGYARIKNGELYIYKMHISPYPYSHHVQLDPACPRKLLIHKKEIKRLIGKTEEKGYTLIPTRVYFVGGWAKIELALSKGKKKHDKRQALKEKELNRDIEQAKKWHGR